MSIRTWIPGREVRTCRLADETSIAIGDHVVLADEGHLLAGRVFEVRKLFQPVDGRVIVTIADAVGSPRKFVPMSCGKPRPP